MPPVARTGPSVATPGCSSARRATPIGVSGDNTTATTMATAALPTPIHAARVMATATSCHRVMPSARKIGYSTDSKTICRPSVWPANSNVLSAASAAKANSAAVSRLMARRRSVMAVLPSWVNEAGSTTAWPRKRLSIAVVKAARSRWPWWRSTAMNTP
jgi:hypothetical protein